MNEIIQRKISKSDCVGKGTFFIKNSDKGRTMTRWQAR